ncbi:Fc.00g027470.m01.CDS01 [Cosmosporella sp. VM-42]
MDHLQSKPRQSRSYRPEIQRRNSFRCKDHRPKTKLDVWNGVITSEFNVDGKRVKVTTQGDFDSDSVAFDIESGLIASGALEVELDFPYPPIHTTKYKYEVFVGSYDFPMNHTTRAINDGKGSGVAHIYREMQDTRSTKATRHQFNYAPVSKQYSRASKISFTAHFSPQKSSPSLPLTMQKRNTKQWHNYWNEGRFDDLTASSNPEADELQRQIILSQYHIRVNSAATGQSLQESGLMNNAWYGKFHMEMVVWHNAYWSTWGR